MDSTHLYAKINTDFVEKEKIIGEQNERIRYYQLHFRLRF